MITASTTQPLQPGVVRSGEYQRKVVICRGGIYGPRPLYPSSPIKGDWYKGGRSTIRRGPSIIDSKKGRKVEHKTKKIGKKLAFRVLFLYLCTLEAGGLIGLRRWSTFPVLFRQKSRWFLQEITATSWGNHGNFLRKSRQLLEEITVISEGFLRELLK